MMEKKDLVGAIIFAAIEFCIGVLIVFYCFNNVFLHRYAGLVYAFYFIVGILFLIVSIGISMLKNWARVLNHILLLGMLFYFLKIYFISLKPGYGLAGILVIFLSPIVILCPAALFYFTRPKVKERFKKE